MKNIVTKLLLLTAICFTQIAQAQDITVASGTDLFITSGDIFHVNGLTLTPSANFTMNNINITKNATVSNSTLNTYVSRVYLLNATSNAYSGTVRIDYADGELNSLTEATLAVNVHNGTAWAGVTSTTNETTANYVVSNSVSGLALRELTLAATAHPLPVNWLSFTATKQGKKVMLNWATASEINSKDFTAQHSANSTTWSNLGTVAAAGNSNTIKNYSHLHSLPLKNYNYYRILQKDLDGKYSYSEVRSVKFDEVGGFSVYNPVKNGNLQLSVGNMQTNTQNLFNLFTANGKLIWTKEFAAGAHNIDVSGLAKGVYILKAGESTKQIVIE